MIDPYAPQEQPKAPVLPQPEPEFAPPERVASGAPASPTYGDVGISQEEMRGNLQGMLAQLLEKFSNYKAQTASTGNSLAELRGKMLRDLFDFFESVGVDPSEPQAVSEYIESLRSENPELAAQLEKILKRALGAEGGDQQAAQQSPVAAVGGPAEQDNGGVMPGGEELLG